MKLKIKIKSSIRIFKRWLNKPNRTSVSPYEDEIIKIFRKMKFTKTLIFCFSSLLFSFYGFAQDAIVKGKVVDENGLLVPGATVDLKGTKAATTTEFDGSF